MKPLHTTFIYTAVVLICSTFVLMYTTTRPKHQAGNEMTAAAVVNGRVIPLAEIDGAARQGIDRGAALDTAINRAVFADAGEKEFGKEAAEAVASATREALAQTYLVQTSRQIEAELAESDVAGWYGKNVSAENFKKVKARYVLVASPEIAQDAANLARSGGDTKRFEALAQGDGFMAAREMPYGIGASVAKLKTGDVVGPITVRDGFLVLVVDGVKDGVAPTLDATRAEIRKLLVQEELAKRLSALRAQATIILK